MERSTNALAELAERFANGTITVKDIDAAGRIVAELAKVRWHNSLNSPVGALPDNDCLIQTMVNCRAIAEKGTDNG